LVRMSLCFAYNLQLARLYIDQPVGVGYSTGTTTVGTSQQAAADVYKVNLCEYYFTWVNIINSICSSCKSSFPTRASVNMPRTISVYGPKGASSASSV
jgi:hypothetical protein